MIKHFSLYWAQSTIIVFHLWFCFFKESNANLWVMPLLKLMIYVCSYSFQPMGLKHIYIFFLERGLKKWIDYFGSVVLLIFICNQIKMRLTSWVQYSSHRWTCLFSCLQTWLYTKVFKSKFHHCSRSNHFRPQGIQWFLHYKKKSLGLDHL